MVIVTDKQFFMEKRLVEKLDLMVERHKRKMDNLIHVDGDEGYGKSNIAAGICYYMGWKLGRKFTVDNVFFDLDELMDFASKTEEQIICWDEGALGGMASEWWKKNQLEFIKLLMISRKKRHFIVICIPKFFKLNEYLVVDRSIALIHVYARNELELGRFVYYSKKGKEKLFFDWRKTRMRNYKKYVTFRGSFLEYLPKVIDEVAYEAKKDYAILNFRKKDKVISDAAMLKIERIVQKKIILNFMKEFPEMLKKDIAKGIGITSDVLSLRIKPKETRVLSEIIE